MKLSEQVCTLDQAKRLKELGVIQNCSLWYHLHLPDTIYRHEAQIIYTGDKTHTDPGAEYAAFTVAELGVILPPQYTSYKISEYGKQFVDGNFWMVETDYYNECEVCTESSTKNLPDTAATTEAEARAALLIHLLETGKATASEVNQRLSNS